MIMKDMKDIKILEICIRILERSSQTLAECVTHRNYTDFVVLNLFFISICHWKLFPKSLIIDLAQRNRINIPWKMLRDWKTSSY